MVTGAFCEIKIELQILIRQIPCFGNFNFVYIILFNSMLGGSLVMTAWRILRLQMGETASSYGG
jgi:hypothetical protein